MNLLIFVMTLLMLMATITYSRLEHYLTTQVQSIEWQGRIRVGVRTLFNQDPGSCVVKLLKSPPNEDTPPKTPAAPKGYGKISQKYFIDPIYRSQHDMTLSKAQELFKTLVRILYSDQPFFKNLERERPTFLDDMINEITQVSSKNTKSFEDVLLEKWGDPDIKRAFSLMLQHTVSYRRPKADVLMRGEEVKDLETLKTAPLGLVTLEDFFHDKTADKIRIWLAQPEMLLALYQNQELVDNLIKERKELYKAVIKDLTTVSDATKQLEQNYGHNRSPYEALIDFTVTKTKPPK